jgi:hypothetical protein
MNNGHGWKLLCSVNRLGNESLKRENDLPKATRQALEEQSFLTQTQDFSSYTMSGNIPWSPHWTTEEDKGPLGC